MSVDLIVIPEDNFIQYNGKALTFLFTCSPEVRAVQWHGDSGTIEYTDPLVPASIIKNIKEVEYYIECFKNRQAELEAADKDRQEKQALLPEPYISKAYSIMLQKEQVSIPFTFTCADTKVIIDELIQTRLCDVENIRKLSAVLSCSDSPVSFRFESNRSWLLTKADAQRLVSLVLLREQAFKKRFWELKDELKTLSGTPLLSKVNLFEKWPD